MRLVALEATKGLHLEFLKKGHHIIDSTGAPHALFPFSQLPFKAVGNISSKVKHFADIVDNFEGEIPKADIRAALEKPVREYMKLPEPFGLKDVGVPYSMSLFICQGDDGSHRVLKMVELSSRLGVDTIRSMCWGSCQIVDWSCIGGTNPHDSRRALQYMLEHLQGFHARAHALTVVKGAAQSEEYDDEAIDAGFEFILKAAPRHNEDLKQLIWSTKVTNNNSGSPVAGWSIKLVEKACHQLCTQQAFAATHSQLWLTIADFEEHIVDLAAILIKQRKHKGIWLLGKAGIGKSPFAKAFAMCVSRVARQDVSDESSAVAPDGQYRLSSEMDFFRGRPGSHDIPDIFDDGDSSSQKPKVLKAFGDISSEEAVSIARWTGCRWA